MKVVLLGLFPSYRFVEELGLKKRLEKRITSWNENLTFALSKINGIELHFITSSRLIKETKTIQYCPSLKITFIYIPPKINTLTLCRYPWWKTAKLIKKIKPDIVHGIGTEHIWGIIATSYKKHIITVHGILNEGIRKNPITFISLKRYMAYLEKKVLRKAKNLIVINPYVTEILPVNHKTNTFFIENAISPIYRQKISQSDNSNQILFIGDYVPRKNILDLIKALNLIYKNINFNLKVIGKFIDNKYKEKINDYLVNKPYIKDKITNIEFRIPEELSNDIAESAFLVVCSNEETAPMVIAESMSMGLPVVATNVGGIKYMIKDNENGFIVEPNNVKQLADRIKKLLKNPELRKKMGKAARKDAIQRYDPKLIAEKTYEAYKKILGE